MKSRAQYKKISNETRKKIIEEYNAGYQLKKISASLDLNLSTVSSIIRVYTKESRVEKKQRGGTKNRKILPEHEFFIMDCLNKDGSLSLNMLRKMTNKKFNLQISTSTIKRCCDSNLYRLSSVSGVLLRTKN
ncbi:hypothetical protein BB560_001586 [Smittium megazygosporum]|uniref:Transposase IS30-like HTH domain-containing protein n=1 Tax=Smittium megazygosporum TaxID=133381 RepID=A0A2T9ZH68_9FUNG|nr:hypothetical protein BB560_001586 [Smittium megazygosporum]